MKRNEQRVYMPVYPALYRERDRDEIYKEQRYKDIYVI